MQHLAPWADVVIIVDVLSFSTCVDVAVARGASILPYHFRDGSAAEFAKENGAVLAGGRGSGSAYSLSPASLESVGAGMKVVLPSPNGAALTVTETRLRRVATTAVPADTRLWDRLRLTCRCSILLWGATLVAGVTLANVA